MLCKSHYKRFYTRNQCIEEGCKRLAKDKKGRCSTHSEEHDDRICTTTSCTNVLKSRANYCNACYMRLWRSSKRRESAKEKPPSCDEQEKSTKKAISADLDALGQIVSPRDITDHQSYGGVWFCEEKERIFLCASELGWTGHQSSSVHFLRRMLSTTTHSEERMTTTKKKRHSFVNQRIIPSRLKQQKRRKITNMDTSFNKLPQYGVCT